VRKRYNFFVGEKTLHALQVVAKRDDTTVSELIRIAIKEHLTRLQHGHSNPNHRPAVPADDARHTG
jgi:hypothetical protein